MSYRRNKKPAKGPNTFVTAAYNIKDDEEMVEFYRSWATDYDHQMLDELKYISPREISLKLSQHLDDRTASVLDLGCGTGLTAQYLHDLGFTNLDGIDLSESMVKVAAGKQIYRNLVAADLNQPLDIQAGRYHAAISSGTFTHGHVGPEPLDEIFRVIKPGGLLACTVHFDLWQSRGFDAKFSALESANRVECLERKSGRYYEDGKPEGWFCIYRKR